MLAPALPLRSAAASRSAPRAARLDPPGTPPGNEHEGGSQQQRRAVRGTVCEERECAAGDEEPATKSRASTCHQPRKREQGDGAKHGRPSDIPGPKDQRSGGRHRTRVRTSPKRSDTRAQVNPPQAEPSPRAKRAVGEGWRPAPVSYPVRKDDMPRHLTNERPGRPASCSFLIHRWFGAGIPGHVLFSSIYWRICSSVIRYSWPTRTACRRFDLIISRTVFALTFKRSAISSVV